mgnify:CR=1 FL=1
MKFNKISPNNNISEFVKDIVLFEEDVSTSKTVLPFFADGLPGLVFHNTPEGQWAQPQNKKMPVSYIYGQTIQPMELHMEGTYQMIVFQLYPFVLSRFFPLNPKEIKDACFDLTQLDHWSQVIHKLHDSNDSSLQIEVIQEFLYNR